MKSVLAEGGDNSAMPMPAGSVRHGEASLEVFDGLQPGIYKVGGWVNPQGDGVAELRAFFVGPAEGRATVPAEVGEPGDELSSKRLRPRSRRLIGWSAKPEELFRYQSIVSIYEGDWGHPYTARFELWFESADGAERKLAETTRQVEGWMR
jgi:hypothetical protein